MSLFRPSLLLVAVFVLTSCVPSPPPPPSIPPEFEQVLLKRLETSGKAFESLRGVAKIRVESREDSFSSSQVLLVRRPDHLRAEALSPFGNPVLVAVADGAELAVLLPTEGRFLRGAATYRNVVRFTRLPLQLPDLIGLLLLDIPVIPHIRAVVEADAGEYRLILEGLEGVRQEVAFDHRLRLLGSSYWHGGELVLRIGYREFDVRSEFPMRISLVMPGEQTEAGIVFSEVEVNVPIPDDRFRLEQPPGYAVEHLR